MFFEQQFVIYYDSGKNVIVDDLYDYIKKNRGIGFFHAHMKFNLGTYKKAAQFTSCSSFDFISNHLGFYLYTSNGLMISPDLLMSEYNKKYKIEYFNYYQRFYNRRMTTAGNKHTTRKYKKPKTQQARRIACGVQKEDGEPEFRGARKYTQLRTYWDDINTRKSCSWKNCTKRKKQYKGS